MIIGIQEAELGRLKLSQGNLKSPYLKIKTEIKASRYSSVVYGFFVKVLERV